LSNSSEDTSLPVETPEGISFEIYPAGLCARAASYTVDTIIKFLVIIAISVISSSFRDSLKGQDGGRWFLFLCLFIIDWFFYFIFEVFFKGQSPGKMIFSIRVVQNDGSHVTASASFLRNILRFADTFLALYHIAFLTIVSTRGFKRLGDIASGTLVVYTSHARAITKFRLAPSIYKKEAITPITPLSFDEKQAAIMFSHRFSILGQKRGDEIVKVWTDSIGFTPFADESGAFSPSEYVLGIAKKYHGVQ
jgi:uncharacterized RDD family membrane protein YckC